jgi:AcrR family transcriptional regulator
MAGPRSADAVRAVTRTKPVRQRADKKLLDRAAWLHAAGDAVAEGGFANLRVLDLAKRLGVTRGSFYWHFADHAELVRALLEHWLEYRRDRAALWVRLVTEQDPEQALLHSLTINFDEGRTSRRAIRIELAVREYAMRDPYAAKVLAESDELRHGRIVELYTALTGDASRARLLALTNYLIIAGADLLLQWPRRDEATIAGIRELVSEVLVKNQHHRARG